jgi:bifunctional UDP-N-acetylglucosamine pyrophosphorylase / glucosamine-1-phosphate N-acetyltransferase
MNPNPLNVVILAAGQGKRMHSDLPKVLHPIAGRPMLRHVLDTAGALGATTICVVYGHGGDQVPQAFASADVVWVKQEPQLGTGHAVMQALPHLDDRANTLVLYGDVPLVRPETLTRLIASAGTDALALLTVHLASPRGYGRIIRDAGKVVRIVEERDASEKERAVSEVNTGILVAPTVKLRQWLPGLGNRNAQGEYYLTDIVTLAVDGGVAVNNVQPRDEWEVQGVNDKAQLAQLERVHQRDVAAMLLDRGVTLTDPARIDVRGELICGRDVSIDVNCVFEGKVELGDNVTVGPNCVIRNATVGADTRLQAFCHIDDAVIGRHSVVGPYARLRPGARLGADVHIGNFVEIKNSEIADHSKVNHLSYIGDATIGQRVNVGAGTITCNYDGVNKHRTVIEDDVFIGSDTQLVAPITVGHGATIGAGSTLTSDAPPGQLTLSRAKQVSYAAWKRPVKVRD